MKKYIVLECWGFGVNYYDASGLVYPDYELEKTGQPIPTMTKSEAESIAQRKYYYQIKEI